MTSLEREGLPLSTRRPRPLPPSGRAGEQQGQRRQWRVKDQSGLWVRSRGRAGPAWVSMRPPTPLGTSLLRRQHGLCLPFLYKYPIFCWLEKGVVCSFVTRPKLCRQGLMYSSLALNSSPEWPWISVPPECAAQVLELQVCTTLPSLCNAETESQGFLHAKLVRYGLHKPSTFSF